MAIHPEQQLISAVLVTGDLPAAMAHGLEETHFTLVTDQWAWLVAFYRQHHRTPSRAAFLQRFPNTTIYQVDDVHHWADMVIGRWMQDTFATAMNRGTLELEQGVPLEEAAKKLQSTLALIDRPTIANEVDVIRDWQHAHASAVTRQGRVNGGGFSGVPSGFPSLDRNTGGFQPGELWIAAARPGQGKSWTLVRWAAEAVEYGKRVLFISLEMRWDAIAYRAHSVLSRKQATKLRSLDLLKGTADLAEYQESMVALAGQVKGSLFVVDSSRGRVSPDTIIPMVERNTPDIVVVDYLTLMDHEGDWQGVSKLSGQMKQLGENFGIPIIAASQLNRSGDGKEPASLTAIAQADAIGQDADGVVTLAQQSEAVLKCRLAKYRSGRDGYKWWLSFKPEVGIVDEITGDQAKRTLALGEDDD